MFQRTVQTSGADWWHVRHLALAFMAVYVKGAGADIIYIRAEQHSAFIVQLSLSYSVIQYLSQVKVDEMCASAGQR